LHENANAVLDGRDDCIILVGDGALWLSMVGGWLMMIDMLSDNDTG